jgi:hypothetical protein
METYATTKKSCQYSEVFGTIELDDFIHEFDNLCEQYMHNSQLFTFFMAWKGLFQHLGGPPMDDYHEFKRTHEI